MRGTDERSGALFSYVDLVTRVPKSHPLRTIRGIVDGALAQLSADFEAMYAPLGRPSIAPEIRKIIYTKNAVEAPNRSLRRIIKTRGSFRTDEATMKLLYLAIRNAGVRWRRPMRGPLQ